MFVGYFHCTHDSENMYFFFKVTGYLTTIYLSIFAEMADLALFMELPCVVMASVSHLFHLCFSVDLWVPMRRNSGIWIHSHRRRRLRWTLMELQCLQVEDANIASFSLAMANHLTDVILWSWKSSINKKCSLLENRKQWYLKVLFSFLSILLEI